MRIKSALVIAIQVIAVSAGAVAANNWVSTVKPSFDQPEKWKAFVEQLKEKNFHYGVVIGAERMLKYFTDLKSKQFAYQTLADSVDFGYPFSLSNDFFTGDLELVGKDSFSQSYNLYKAVNNERKGMKKWSDIYFGRVDRENFPKYFLYKGLTESDAKKVDEATKDLDEALNLAKGPENAVVAVKAARTLARIYYEQIKYKEAFDIYESYLLRLNPMEPNDWVEAAWCLYRMGKFEEALGFVYNLEGFDDQEPVFLEKYILRALIYREKCDQNSTAKLQQSFDRFFGPTLEGIKTGKSLKTFPLLKRIYTGANDYYRNNKILGEIEFERKREKELNPEFREIAEFMYTTEVKIIEKNRDTFEDEALDAAARNLVILGESLKFLRFDVAREKFNPDKVFAVPEVPQINLVVEKSPTNFEIHWIQWGDFWRDERLLYRGIVKNWCK